MRGPSSARVRQRRARRQRAAAHARPRRSAAPAAGSAARARRQRRQRRRELRLAARRWLRRASVSGSAERSPGGASTRCGRAAASTRTAPSTRFLGLPSTAARRRPAARHRLHAVRRHACGRTGRSAASLQLTAGYLRGQQDGGRRYDQLLGGDGNLVADLRNLMADLVYARLERLGAGWLDRVDARLLVQRAARGAREPGRQRQPARERQPRAGAHGRARAARPSAAQRLGAPRPDARRRRYFRSASPRRRSPATRRAARSPRGAGACPTARATRTAASSCRTCSSAVPGRLRLNGALRCARRVVRQRRRAVRWSGGKPLWPDDSYDTSAFTFRVGAAVDRGGAVPPRRRTSAAASARPT